MCALTPSDRERTERAEAIARDRGTALLAIVNTREGAEPNLDNVWQRIARAALDRTPSFSGEEGTEG